MSEFADELAQVRERLDAYSDKLERHRRVVEGISESPDDYEADEVRDYLSSLEDELSVADFLERADASLEPLEAATDAAAQAVLEGATVSIDDHPIEGIELTEFDDDPDVMRATILVESPKVNQLRGGRPLLELPDGRRFRFTIAETHIADVREDKTGYLRLVLGLDEL